jgi:NCS1 family nucleobase:cation symporter-1
MADIPFSRLSLNLEYINKVRCCFLIFSSFYPSPAVTRHDRIPPPPTMASDHSKLSNDEKNVSPAVSAVEPVEPGHVSALKRRFPGFSLEVRHEESSFAATKGASNADFDPIPPSKRTWNWGAYVAYWMADAWAVSNWEVGESPRDVLRLWSRSARRC